MSILPLPPEGSFASDPLHRVIILEHPRVAASQHMVGELRALIEGLGVSVVTGSVWDTQALHTALPEVDACITLGGDGSMLRTARVAAPFQVPILGINLGKLGFLAEIEPRQAAERLPAILRGNYWIEERMMIQAELVRDGETLLIQDCLNEVVVARRQLSRVIRVDTRIDGHQLTTYTADGVLVATPTGSTAYGLAAGGPILHPEVWNMLLLPISAHLSLRSPLVLPARTEVRLSVHSDHEAGASFDGQSDVVLRADDQMIVRAAEQRARFIRTQERTYFYHTLVHKLGIKH